MLIEAASTELAYQISDEEQRQILQNHFSLFYNVLGECQLIPGAAFESVDGFQRCLSGIPVPYHNAVLGFPVNELWDTCINEQVHFFNEAKVPFVWCFDEETPLEFKQKLIAHGFQDGGIFRGVIGTLDKPIPHPEVPADFTLELVENELVMDEFNEVLCSTFNIQGVSKELCKKAMWKAAQNEHHTMYHWLARKEGKAVSVVSTMIDGNVVSFWNGASLPEVRRQGVSTALRCLALKDSISRGCRIGISYLMSEGLAFGICTKLGYQTKWRFNVFLSPNTGI